MRVAAGGCMRHRRQWSSAPNGTQCTDEGQKTSASAALGAVEVDVEHRHHVFLLARSRFATDHRGFHARGLQGRALDEGGVELAVPFDRFGLLDDKIPGETLSRSALESDSPSRFTLAWSSAVLRSPEIPTDDERMIVVHTIGVLDQRTRK